MTGFQSLPGSPHRRLSGQSRADQGAFLRGRGLPGLSGLGLARRAEPTQSCSDTSSRESARNNPRQHVRPTQAATRGPRPVLGRPAQNSPGRGQSRTQAQLPQELVSVSHPAAFIWSSRWSLTHVMSFWGWLGRDGCAVAVERGGLAGLHKGLPCRDVGMSARSPRARPWGPSCLLGGAAPVSH